MLKRSRLTRAAGVALAAGLVTAACGSDDQTTSPSRAAAATTVPAPAPHSHDGADSPAADLRATLETTLQEHVYLAAAATGAALGGRPAEFEAAATTLDTNSVKLSRAVGSVYGTDAEQAFLPLWRRHIGFFVDYTQGLATKDKAKSDKAVADLTQYTQDFGAFLSSANPNLPKDTVAELVTTHVLSLKDAVDAQAAGDAKTAYTNLADAAHHMTMIAEPLSNAIIKQFPDRFQA